MEELPLTCQTTSIVEGCGTTIIASAGNGAGEMSNNNTSTLVKYIENLKRATEITTNINTK